jgi:hypothetical protein
MKIIPKECYQNPFGLKDPELWLDKWILHNNSAPVHDTLNVCKLLAKESITKIDCLPYSPDLASCDFWLFQKVRNGLMGQKFLTFVTSNIM